MEGGFARTRRVAVGDLEIAYREAGSGPPLVFVHGFPLSSLTWRKVVPALAEDYRCIALDLPGAGRSSMGAGVALDLGSLARALGGFLTALDIPRAALVAHDTGACIARSAAIAEPERVSELILADTDVPGHHPLVLVAFQMVARLPGSLAVFRALLRSRRLVRSRVGLGQLVFDRATFDFDEFHQTVIEATGRSDEAVRCQRRFLVEFTLADMDAARGDYHRLAMPKCLIWGEHDHVFPAAQAARLVAMLPPPVCLETVPGARLLVHEERPDAWLAVVRGFLGRSSRLSSAAPPC